MADVMKSDHWRLMVAEDPEAGVVGFCLARTIIDEIELLKIAVSETFSGRGIGRRLLEELIAGARGCVSINLEVRRSNGAALQLYQAHGFTIVGQRPRYYPDGEDALLMTLEL